MLTLTALENSCTMEFSSVKLCKKKLNIFFFKTVQHIKLNTLQLMDLFLSIFFENMIQFPQKAKDLAFWLLICNYLCILKLTIDGNLFFGVKRKPHGRCYMQYITHMYLLHVNFPRILLPVSYLVSDVIVPFLRCQAHFHSEFCVFPRTLHCHLGHDKKRKRYKI